MGAELTAKRSRSVLGCWYCFVLSLFNKSSVVFESIRSKLNVCQSSGLIAAQEPNLEVSYLRKSLMV